MAIIMALILYTHVDCAFHIPQHLFNALQMWNVKIKHVLGKIANSESTIWSTIYNGMHKTSHNLGIGIGDMWALSIGESC